MISIRQYLQPRHGNFLGLRYVSVNGFCQFAAIDTVMGFVERDLCSIWSSDHADDQAHAAGLE